MQTIIDAAGVIETAGFTIFDDLLHGFGGGYFPPILGCKSRPAGPLPDMLLEENMTVVVQPNVITPDADCDDTANKKCVSCEIDLDKTVALDDDCNGVADGGPGSFTESVTQDPNECVVYQVCASNVGQQNISGVVVTDADLGNVVVNIGTEAAGTSECRVIPAQAANVGLCTEGEGSCRCDAVPDENLAVITSAVCASDGTNACDLVANPNLKQNTGY